MLCEHVLCEHLHKLVSFCCTACFYIVCVMLECVCRLADLVFTAVHVFCVRICVDYLVLIASAVSVSGNGMHFVCEGLICMMRLYQCV